MSNPCTSDPTSGCDDSAVIAAVNESNTVIIGELEDQDTKLDEIKASMDACCTLLSRKLDTIINLVNIVNAKL